MKTLLTSLLLILFPVIINAQTGNCIHTNGRYILGSCNDTLTLKGINYAPYNWGYTLSELKINEIAQTGANAIRLPWYKNNSGAPVYSNYAALDSAISKCVQYKMIAIIELHDFTCDSTIANFSTGTSWWTNSAIVSILNRYKESVIVNIANEALHVSWAINSTTALGRYKNAYQTFISTLRGVQGFDFPIMIDAPDCGQNSDAFITSNTAVDLVTFDPKHNLIFSAHAYWYGYTNNDSLQMATKINNVLAQNIPLVLGEVANLQDDASACQYTLSYKPILNYCKGKKVGWLAWSWDHDVCPSRQISSNGSFNSLTPYGNDIVNNSNYGLANGTLRSSYLVNSACRISTSITEYNLPEDLTLFPNPSNGEFSIQSPSKINAVKAFDILGNEISLTYLNETTFSFDPNVRGIFFIKITTNTGREYSKKLIIK